MQDPITAGTAAASSAVTRFTTLPMLASLQPLIREWLLAVQAKIGAHRQDEQPWWASTNNLTEEFVASAKRIGWHAGLVSTRDSAPAWDIRLDEPDGGPRYAVCAIGLLLSMSDNADAMRVLERGLGHAKASATELPLEHGRERLVLAFAIPYRPAGDDPNDDFARQVDTWLARFPFGCRCLFVSTWMCCRKARPRLTDLPPMDGRQAQSGVAFSFGYFSLGHAREK